MKKVIFILFSFLTLNSFGQCWQSLDVDGDTNSLHYAIQNDGTLWKLSPYGSAPVQLGFQKSWKHCYTSGTYATFLIADDSTLWGFGSNYYGELGIGNTNNQSTLIQLNNSKWISLSSSWGHTTAIKADGTMWFWGQIWPNAAILLPTQIGTDSNWKEIHTDYSNAIALKNNGTIWFGNVGGTLSQVGSDSDWNYIWMQSDNGAWLAIKNNGTMWENGVQVGTDSDWKLVKGENITLALKNNGSAWYWDYGDDLVTTPPILLNQNIGFKDITAFDYIYAISTSGELYKGFYNWSSVPYLSIDTSSNYLCASVSFHVFNDPTQQCYWGAGIEGVTITIQPGNYVSTTDHNGFATVANLLDGNYAAIVDTTSLNWASNCPTTIVFNVINGYEPTDSNYFYLFNTNPCSDPDVSIYAPFLRRCFSNQNVYVSACNQVTATGVLNASYVDVELDPLLTVNSATIPFTPQGNNVFRFQTGNLNPGQCVNFSISTTVSCNAMLGQTLCMDANLFPVQSCALDTIPSDPPSGGGGSTGGGTLDGLPEPCTLPWDQSSLSVDGWCQNDTIYFTITNTGQLGGGDMECYSPVWVTVDGVVTLTDSIMIQGGQTITYSFPGDGATWILNAEQHPLHPGNSHPNAHVEACGDTSNWTPDEVNDFPVDDADPVVDIYCGVVTGSYDPNDKTGFPIGQSDQFYIQPNQQLQYAIRFQNTGTDTAFTVVIRDTLDLDLNIFTVTPGVSSHNYEFRMYGPRVLEWTFNNINLPDSAANQVGSNGFVTYHVEQVPYLAPGTEINNDADIYFDFNAPITTNTTMHRIFEGFVSVLNLQDLSKGKKQFILYPNPTSSEITITSEKFSNEAYTLCDQMGRVVGSGKLSGTNTTISLSSLSNGIYLLKVEGNYEAAMVVKE